MLQSCMLTEALQAILAVSLPALFAVLLVLLFPVEVKCWRPRDDSNVRHQMFYMCKTSVLHV